MARSTRRYPEPNFLRSVDDISTYLRRLLRELEDKDFQEENETNIAQVSGSSNLSITKDEPAFTFYDTAGGSTNYKQVVFSGLYIVQEVSANGTYKSNPIEAESGAETLRLKASAGDSTLGGSIIWTEGNDGQGSGLDADLLDGFDTSIAASAGTDGYVLTWNDTKGKIVLTSV